MYLKLQIRTARKIPVFTSHIYIPDNFSNIRVDTLLMEKGDGVYVVNGDRMEVWKAASPVKLYKFYFGGVFADDDHQYYDNFLTSSYLFESGQLAYNENRDRYLQPKSDREFWKRNLISMGWGAQYVNSGNPFASYSWLTTGFGYAIDAATVATIGTGVLGKNSAETKITSVLIGVGFSALFKVLFNGLLLKADMNQYNVVAQSGYPVPKIDFWDFSKRFGMFSKDTAGVRTIP